MKKKIIISITIMVVLLISVMMLSSNIDANNTEKKKNTIVNNQQQGMMIFDGLSPNTPVTPFEEFGGYVSGIRNMFRQYFMTVYDDDVNKALADFDIYKPVYKKIKLGKNYYIRPPNFENFLHKTYKDFPEVLTPKSKIIYSLGNAFTGSGSGIRYGKLSGDISYDLRIDIGLSVIVTNIKKSFCDVSPSRQGRKKIDRSILKPNLTPYPKPVELKDMVLFNTDSHGCYQDTDGSYYLILEIIELKVISLEEFNKNKGAHNE